MYVIRKILVRKRRKKKVSIKSHRRGEEKIYKCTLCHQLPWHLAESACFIWGTSLKNNKKINKCVFSVSFAVLHSSTIELNVKILHQWNSTDNLHVTAAVAEDDGWSSTTDCTNVTTLRPLHTHNTAAHSGTQVSGFECFWLRLTVWAKKENVIRPSTLLETVFLVSCLSDSKTQKSFFF